MGVENKSYLFRGKGNRRVAFVNNAILCALLVILLMSSCEKKVTYDRPAKDPLKEEIQTIVPANLEDSVVVDPDLNVTFREGTDTAVISSASIVLTKGSSVIPGKLTHSGMTATFSALSDLTAESEYLATVSTSPQSSFETKDMNEYTWKFKTGKLHTYNTVSVVSVTPLDKSGSVSVSSPLTITFNCILTPKIQGMINIGLRNGSSPVAGNVTFSGESATFQPVTALKSATLYSGSITVGPSDKSGNNFSWSFTTEGTAADVTPPTILSVVPASGATAASTTTKVNVTFSEPMNASTITSSSFTLKKGSSSVAGTISYTGNTGTFSPSVALDANTAFTAAITTSVKDVSGNALPSNYTWSFTTAAIADVTPPTISSIVPANNATSVASNAEPTATFSEPMDASTITTSTFTLKQGSVSISGNVTYSGTTATFTPSTALTGSTVYTAAVTTGVKDASGNTMASNYTWSFTTVATTPSGKSFSTDVVPILNLCNTCHNHGWTTSSNASTFYNNLVNSGYVNSTSPTTSKIYQKLNGGHPPGSTVSAAQVNTILTWMTEGSKNN